MDHWVRWFTYDSGDFPKLPKLQWFLAMAMSYNWWLMVNSGWKWLIVAKHVIFMMVLDGYNGLCQWDSGQTPFFWHDLVLKQTKYFRPQPARVWGPISLCWFHWWFLWWSITPWLWLSPEANCYKVVPQFEFTRSVGEHKYYFTRVDEWGLYL